MYSIPENTLNPKNLPVFNISKYQKILVFVLVFITAVAIVSLSKSDVPPGFMGYRLFKVSGVSMEPTIQNGSILLVKKVEPEKIQANDVITYLCYRGHHACTTHRVIEIEKISGDKRQFITRGDGNQVNDPIPIPQDQVVGVVQYMAPPNIFNLIVNSRPIIYLVGIVLTLASIRYIDFKLLKHRYN